MTNLQRFQYFTRDLPSPDLFIDFNFYFLISSCIARKVWIGLSTGYAVYANQYFIFVANPAVGKSLPAGKVAEILANLEDIVVDEDTGEPKTKRLINLGPDCITFEKLIYRAALSTRTVSIVDSPKKYIHSSITFCLGEEMDTLFRRNTDDTVTFFVKAWDCRSYENDTYKHGKQQIKNICVNFLGCITPDKLGKLMGTGLLENGFTSRVIFLYADNPRPAPTLIETDKDQMAAINELSVHLRKLCKLSPTEVTFAPDAWEWYDNYCQTKLVTHRINDNKRLQDYYARKKMHILKLAMAVHYAESLTPIIEVEDIKKALRLLEKAEINMHRALCASSTNPLSALASSMLRTVQKNGGATKKKLLLMHFDEAKEGEDSIAKALNYLLTTGQIKNCPGDERSGGPIYKVAS